jgi:hypothetical protein
MPLIDGRAATVRTLCCLLALVLAGAALVSGSSDPSEVDFRVGPDGAIELDSPVYFEHPAGTIASMADLVARVGRLAGELDAARAELEVGFRVDFFFFSLSG